jgi:ubiquinone/menaquinone biosynthesis C-methylase UbiE
MQPETGFEQLKRRMKDTWMAGDFGQIARFTAQTAEEFVARLPIAPGMPVLDVACGTGNLAIPAARKGAMVTGMDLAPNLLEQARQRAAAEGLEVQFDEGDAEQLPYEDGRFDLAMSMYGAMFAPRPERVAEELARVVRGGGTIAMANWTAGGFVGRSFAVTARHVPPPEGLPAPVLWGDEEVVRQRFGPLVSRIEATRRVALFDYQAPARQVVQFFREYFGPTKMGFARLDEAGQAALAADQEKLWQEYNEAGGDRTLVRAEYLEVIATRA